MTQLEICLGFSCKSALCVSILNTSTVSSVVHAYPSGRLLVSTPGRLFALISERTILFQQNQNLERIVTHTINETDEH